MAQGFAGLASAQWRGETHSVRQVMPLFDAAVAIDPEYVWVQREAGWAEIWAENPDAARLRFERALDISNDDANALYGLGRAAYQSGAYEEALGHFRNALQKDETEVLARVYLVQSLRKLRRYRQAIREADRAIKDTPDVTSFYYEKAKAQKSIERRGDALETLKHAVSLFPDNGFLLYHYADTLTDDAEYADALVIIDRVIATDNVDEIDWGLKAFIAIQLERYDLAKSAAFESLKIAPDYAWAEYYLALAFTYSDDTETAVTRFDRAMSAGLPDYMVSDFVAALTSQAKYAQALTVRIRHSIKVAD